MAKELALVVMFAWPWIFLLLPLPLLVLQFRRQADTSHAISLPGRVTQALDTVNALRKSRHNRQLGLLWLAWLALLGALSQPSVPGDAKAQPASGRTMVLAIDLSSSMERKDFLLNNEAVDRLTVVKEIAQQFILNRQGDRVGLVLFSTDTFVASPPSFDLESVAHILGSSGTGMAGRTTAIGDAIGMAISSLRDDPAPDKAIVLLSDGTNNAGSVEPESAARLARELGMVVHTIGLASDGGSDDTSTQVRFSGAAADLDESTLQSIADISGGRFFRAATTDQLAQVYREIDKLEGGESRPPPIIVHQQVTPVCILALLVLTLAYYWLGQRRAGIST